MANDSYQLVVRNAPQSGLTAGQVIALEDDVLTLGRDPLSDIILDDAEVSRHHAKLVRQAAGYEIQDMGSTNGSFVDGKRLGGEPLALKPGQVVMLGSNVTLVYQAIVAVDPLATVVAPAAAVQEEFPVVQEEFPVVAESAEEVEEEVEIPMPSTAPAEVELEAVDELDVVVGEVAEVMEEEDAEMATMMDESPIAAPLPEPEPLPEFSPAPELPDEEPVFEPLPVPEPPAATFEELDERTFVDSAAPVSDFIEAPASPPPPVFDQPDEAKGGSNRNIIIIAVVVVLLICCCLAILAGVVVANGALDGVFG